MCGIAGVYRFDGKPVDRGLLQRMTNVICHRGPDDEGHHIQNRVGLGNRRLSILDLSPRGKQPMSNEDGTIWVTYNGEIYNFRELRTDLIGHGHCFRSDTDTEVILHLYEEEGMKCLRHLNGMFTFALWDAREEKLFMARDRLGIKPLFYYLDQDKLLFGSEIKCILCCPTVERRTNLEALHHFLSFNYTAAPLTMFEGIQQLLPGHYLVIEDGRVSVAEYWDLEYNEGGDPRSIAHYQEELEDLLRRAVERMLVSDVPFGVFLSGGVDSSSIMYFMSQISQSPVKSFSIGFEETSYSELDYARRVARHCFSEHYEEIIRPDGLGELLPKLVWHAEEPTADASMVPLYYLSQMAMGHVKMVLSGDGSDELFAGYETYSAYYAAQLYRKIPAFLRRRILTNLINCLPVSDKSISFESKAKRFIRGAGLPPEMGHFYWRLILDEQAKRELYVDGLREQLAQIDTFERTYKEYFQKTSAKNAINRMLYVDTRFYLPNDMLVKVDRMSMAHSLEVRVPFLDHKLVEFLATVPASLKLRHFVDKKYLLKKMMAGKLPRQVLYRRKQGFNIPVGKWVREQLRDFVQDILSESRIRRMGFFKPDYIRKLLSDHLERRWDNGYQIWGLVIFFLWWDAFIEGGMPKRNSP